MSDLQVNLNAKIMRQYILSNMQNYKGTYDFGIRKSELFGDPAEIITQTLPSIKDFDINDTNQYQPTTPAQAISQTIPLNFKKIIQDIYNTNDYRTAINEKALTTFIKNVAGNLNKVYVVELEEFIDNIIQEHINANPTLTLQTADPITNSVDAITDINKEVITLSKPNTRNASGILNYVAKGTIYLIVKPEVSAQWTTDVIATLYNGKTLQTPFKVIKEINPNAFANDTVGDGKTPYGYIIEPDALFIQHHSVDFYNILNTQNQTNYLKLHTKSRIGVLNNYAVIQLRA